jgi:hypothetical protein
VTSAEGEDVELDLTTKTNKGSEEAECDACTI